MHQHDCIRTKSWLPPVEISPRGGRSARNFEKKNKVILKRSHILDFGIDFYYQLIFNNNPLLIILQVGKIHWFWFYFTTNYNPLYEDFDDDLGIDFLLCFQEKTQKINSDIFETFRRYILNHIDGTQNRFWRKFSLSRILSPLCLPYEWFFNEFQLHLVSARYSHQNNVWIRLVCALRSTWDVKLSIYTDISHILDSGTDFCYQSIFSSNPLIILQVGKNTPFLALL
jgi:hypothetical protein